MPGSKGSMILGPLMVLYNMALVTSKLRKKHPSKQMDVDDKKQMSQVIVYFGPYPDG